MKKNKMWLCFLLLLAVCLTVTSAALAEDPTDWEAGQKGFVSSKDASLFMKAPNGIYEPVSPVEIDTPFTVKEVSEHHVRIDYEEEEYWLHTFHVRHFQYFDEQKTATVNNPNPADRLHLRKKAASSSDTLGKYYNGTKVVLLDQKNTKSGWTRVRIGDLEGYMMTKYLVFGEEAKQILSYQPEVIIDNRSGEGLNFRIAPKGNADIIQLLQDGTKVTVLGISDQWLHIMIGDKTGFIRSFGTNPKLVYQEEKEETESFKKARVTCNCSVYLKPFDESDLTLNPYIADELNRGTLSENDVVTVYEVSNGWALVSFGSHKYYVRTSALAFP